MSECGTLFVGSHIWYVLGVILFFLGERLVGGGANVAGIVCPGGRWGPSLAVGGMFVTTTLTTVVISYNSGKGGDTRVVTRDRDSSVFTIGSDALNRLRACDCRNVLPTTSTRNVGCRLALRRTNRSSLNACGLAAACLKAGSNGRTFASDNAIMAVVKVPGSDATVICRLVSTAPKRRGAGFLTRNSDTLAVVNGSFGGTISGLGCALGGGLWLA